MQFTVIDFVLNLALFLCVMRVHIRHANAFAWSCANNNGLDLLLTSHRLNLAGISYFWWREVKRWVIMAQNRKIRAAYRFIISMGHIRSHLDCHFWFLFTTMRPRLILETFGLSRFQLDWHYLTQAQYSCCRIKLDLGLTETMNLWTKTYCLPCCGNRNQYGSNAHKPIILKGIHKQTDGIPASGWAFYMIGYFYDAFTCKQLKIGISI